MSKAIKWIAILVGIYFVIGMIYMIVPDAIADAKDKNSKAKIEKKIADRDFVAAREALQNVQYKEERKKYEKKINTAELMMHYSTGDLSSSTQLALELGCSDVFLDLVSKDVANLYQNHRIENLMSCLAAWKFNYSFHKKVSEGDSYDYSNAIDHTGSEKNQELYNVSYNDERSAFNNTIDAVFNLALFKDDLVTLKQCVMLYQPLAELKSNKNKDFIFELSYAQRDAAKVRAKDSGINL